MTRRGSNTFLHVIVASAPKRENDVGPEENQIRLATAALDCFGRLMIPGLTILALKGCCRRCHEEDKVERNNKGNHAVRLFQIRKNEIDCLPTNHDVTLQPKGFRTNKSQEGIAEELGKPSE